MSRAMLGMIVEVTRESAALSQTPRQMSASRLTLSVERRWRQEPSVTFSDLGEAIGAAAGAGKNVRQAFDADVFSEHTLEERNLLAA